MKHENMLAALVVACLVLLLVVLANNILYAWRILDALSNIEAIIGN